MAAELLVSDRGGNRILKFDASTGDFLDELVGAASAGDLQEPSAMALTADDVLLVASRLNGKVLRYDVETGEFLGDFATGINGPSGLLVDEQRGQLLVSEMGNFDAELIRRFDLSTGESLEAWGAGTGPAGRSDLAFGSDGMLYANSFFDGRVLRFDGETGQPRPSVPGDTTATFAGPVDEFLGANGLLFVEDSILTVGLFSFNVFEFNLSDGSAVGELINGEEGQLFFPDDMVLDHEGNVLVSSLGNDDPSNGLPLGPGYIGKFNAETGEAINPFFIVGSGDLVQPSSMLLLADAAAPMLLPGDADQDLDFDQFDLIKVQVAAKYLTSQPATWGEGDWNGGPGGSPGDPPRGDGVFDNHDIIAALNTGVYATGPYSATTLSAAEPDSAETVTAANLDDAGLAGPNLEGLAAALGPQDRESAGWLEAAGHLTDGSPRYVPVPEPATGALLLCGLPLVLMAGRGRKLAACGRRGRPRFTGNRI
jgi:outer membrane protein assembly factor BamB